MDVPNLASGNGEANPVPVSLSTLFGVFFKIACTSFGGYMAMISVVEQEIVERRKLMRHEDMLDGISLATLLPGPVAVNLVTYVGYRLRGGFGALVSAVGAVLPSFVLIVALAIAYFRFGQVPAVSKLFMGFIPAMAAIILSAAWSMSRKAVTGWREGVIAIAAGAGLLAIGGFLSTLAIILGSGVLGWLWFRERPTAGAAPPSLPNAPRFNANALLITSAAPLAAFDPGLITQVFTVFAGMSVMLFGGGYVFIPLIQEIVVNGQGWVTAREFIDAIALGQITPGPILVSAAFIGLKVAGLAGAVAATIGIYLPPALLMVGSANVLDRIKRSRAIQAALKGVRPAVVGMIFAASYVVASTAAPVWISVAIFAAALYALLRFKLTPAWIIPVSGALGYVLY
jgi:chromate transporter